MRFGDGARTELAAEVRASREQIELVGEEERLIEVARELTESEGE